MNVENFFMKNICAGEKVVVILQRFFDERLTLPHLQMMKGRTKTKTKTNTIIE